MTWTKRKWLSENNGFRGLLCIQLNYLFLCTGLLLRSLQTITTIFVKMYAGQQKSRTIKRAHVGHLKHEYVHTCTHTYMHTYTHTYIHIYTHTYINPYIHTYIHTYVHTHTHTYIHTHIHTYIHTRIHIYIQRENVLFNDALNTFYVRLYGVRHNG